MRNEELEMKRGIRARAKVMCGMQERGKNREQ
jgi:hypothetical protein